MKEWKEYKISDIIDEISMGPFGSNIKRDNYVDFGVPYLNGSNLSSYKLNEDSFYYVTEEKARSLGRCVAKRGDIIVTHRGTIGQISYIPNDSKYGMYLTGNSQFRISVNTRKIRPDFLVYFFHTRTGQYRLLSNASQVGVPALARPTSTFKELLVPVPPMSVQDNIMDILHSIDDKIEVNRRINDNLELQAQALFKSWFVDFEPFKDGDFVESELGMIPKGWQVGKIGDICQLENGFAFKSESYNDYGAYKIVTIKNVQDGYLDINGANSINDIPKKMPSHCNLKIGDIILSLTGNVGRCCFVTKRNLLLNQRVAKIKPYNESNWGFVYTLFRMPDFKYRMISIARGTAQANLSPVETSKLLIVIPPSGIIKEYSTFATTIYLKMISNMKQSYYLASMRDTLLPRLMYGEIKLDEITL